MYIRKTKETDILSVLAIYRQAISFMRENGNREQWNDFDSLRANVLRDVRIGVSYVLVDDEKIKGVFSLISGEEPTYAEIDGKWIYDTPYLTIHRLAIKENRKGYGKACISYAMLQSDHIRIDTHEMNHPMRGLIEKMGFSYCGIITLPDKSKRFAYEKIIDFSDRLLSWYLFFKRDLPWRKDHEFYHVYLSEIMLQQTRAESVKPYYERFLSTLPTLKDLANASEDVYLKLWQGLGYYSRVKNLSKAAKYIVSNYEDGHRFTREELLSMPGIGPYSANAILSISYDERCVAVDGNLLRVFSRLNCYVKDIRSNSAKRDCEEYFLPLIRKNSSLFNQSLMDLGEIICSPSGEPHCLECPLKKYCLSYQNHSMNLYPMKSSSKSRKEVELTVFLLVYKGRYLIRKRSEKGLLSSLYEFWNVEEHLNPEDARNYLEKVRFELTYIQKLEDSRHVFSHVVWNMRGYKVELSSLPTKKDFLLVTKEEILETYSIPSAFHLFLKKVEESD